MDAQCCVLVKFYERKQTAGISLCSIRRRSHAFGNTLVRPNARVNIYITRRTSHSPSHQKPIKNSYVRCHFLSCSVRRITRFFMIALWGRDHKHRVLRESLFRWVVIRGCSMCESVAALTPPPPPLIWWQSMCEMLAWWLKCNGTGGMRSVASCQLLLHFLGTVAFSRPRHQSVNSHRTLYNLKTFSG